MAVQLSEEVAEKVLRQVEFYFSESNLPRDKFLRGLIEQSEEGMVSLPVICSFTRMRNHLDLKKSGPDNVPPEVTAAVAEVLRKSSSLIVSEDGEKVGRKCKLLPLDELQEQVDSRTVAAGPLSYDAKLEDLENFFKGFGKLNSIRLPRHPISKKVFSGYALVEFSTDEEAADMIKSKVEYDGANLEFIAKKDFEPERLDSTEDGHDEESLQWLGYEDNKKTKNKHQAAQRETETDDYPRGLIIAFKLEKKSIDKTDTDVAAEPTDTGITRDDIKQVMLKYGTVKYVDFTMGEASGFLRFEKPENSAKAHAAANTAEDSGLVVKDYVVKVEILDGDTEKEYWVKLREGQNKRRGFDGKNRGRGHQGRGWNTRSQKGDSNSKKRKGRNDGNDRVTKAAKTE